MQANEIVVSIEMLKDADVDGVIASVGKEEFSDYRAAFEKSATKAKEGRVLIL